MAYQARRDKHRTTAREFRVANATAAHDLVLEMPGEGRLFVLLLLIAAGQTNSPPAAHRNVGTTDARRVSGRVFAKPSS